MAVIDIAKDAQPAAVKLLLAQSYARIGADQLAAKTASEAIEAILTSKKAEPEKGFSVLEMRALRSWLDRLDGAELGFDENNLTALRGRVFGRTTETREESVQLVSELDEMRQRVAATRTAEQRKTRRYRLTNVIAGTLAGGLAAASGVVGVAKGPWGWIAVLAFLSAAITAVLTTIKPAEREKESEVRADALGQLAAAIDLFDIDRPDDPATLLPAVKQVHERLAVAEGHGKILPLVASSQSATGTVITSISPAEGSTAGGQDLIITGTGFTDATRVRFGGTAASAYDPVSDTEITAKTPPHRAGTVKVTVTGRGGTSPPHSYTYQPPQKP